MPKLIWEKKLQEAVKLQQRFGWSVRNMRGSSPASKMPKTPAKPSYSLVGDLHGMQGGSGSIPFGSIRFSWI